MLNLYNEKAVGNNRSLIDNTYGMKLKESTDPDKLEEAAKKNIDNDSLKEKIRKEYFDKTTSSNEEFSKEINKYYRGGSDEAKKIIYKINNASRLISANGHIHITVHEAKDEVNVINALQREAENDFKVMGDNEYTIFNKNYGIFINYIDCCRTNISCCGIAAFNFYHALNDYIAQNYRIATELYKLGAITTANKNESFIPNYLEDVKLV